MSTGGEHPGAEQAALHDSAGLSLPKSRSALAAAAASPLTNAIATGPSNSDAMLVEPGVVDRPAGQRVLEDLVLGAGRCAASARSSASSWHREPAVLGEHGGVGLRELRADLVDDRDLLGSCHACAPLGSAN